MSLQHYYRGPGEWIDQLGIAPSKPLLHVAFLLYAHGAVRCCTAAVPRIEAALTPWHLNLELGIWQSGVILLLRGSCAGAATGPKLHHRVAALHW